MKELSQQNGEELQNHVEIHSSQPLGGDGNRVTEVTSERGEGEREGRGGERDLKCSVEGRLELPTLMFQLLTERKELV